ncbi:MAG: amino acid permease [Gammaproteobacteria bacterium]|nr:amino acid permease [Gammaproteobacteria bacterium]
MAKTQNKLGLCMLTTLVAGNMIGSGIFMLPANLATVGSISLISWGITTVGAFLLAIVFSKMSALLPRTGGPYAYAEAGFGRFIGFQTAYNYWVAILIGNAAVVISMIGYLSIFWPALKHPAISASVSIAILWLVTFINIIGVRSIGIFQLLTTILKFIPLILIGVLGWFYFHPHYLVESFNVTSRSNFSAISYAATLTFWAFIGLESATVPAGYVENPKRNIPLATLIGTVIAAIIYIGSSAAIMGMIPASILAKSSSPFAAAAHIIFGNWGEWFIAIGTIISCLGTLNGWILLQGQVPMAAADDNLFPKIFSKRNKAGIPAIGLMITTLLASVLLLLTSRADLVQQFQIIILIATLASLIPYLYTSMAQVILLKKNKIKEHIKAYTIIAILACIYALWAIFGSGKDIIYYGSILIFTSIPLYAWLYWKKN